MVSYLVIFLASLGWSGHCIGMCGGFALSLAAQQRGMPRLLAHQALFHAGKTFTYVFLGALAAAAGAHLQRHAQWLGLLAGLTLLLIGLNTFGVFRRARGFSAFLDATPLCGFLRGFMQLSTALAAFLLGLFTGFLPCGLVYAMLAYAATLQSLPDALLSMAAFGIGTVPALLLLGATGGFLKNRVPLMKLSGALTILLGLVTILRGFDFLHGACCPHHLFGSN